MAKELRFLGATSDSCQCGKMVFLWTLFYLHLPSGHQYSLDPDQRSAFSTHITLILEKHEETSGRSLARDYRDASNEHISCLKPVAVNTLEGSEFV
jgi:hypothetical protein